MKRLPLLGLTAALLALAGCGSGSSSSSTPPLAPGRGGQHARLIHRNLELRCHDPGSDEEHRVHPKAVQAKVGQTVQWVNDDTPAHDVTYVSGPKFTSSGLMNPGAKFQIKLTQPGTIDYVCTIQTGMTATIAVTQ